MSQEYDKYLEEHIRNVKNGFEWLRTNLPQLFEGRDDISWKNIDEHDKSKYNKDEYDAYDKYFYGGNRSFEVVDNFNKAWLLHIHRNAHHWQHWVLINDEPNEGETLIEMPYNNIIEMICDWWAFSWQKKDLSEIFSWYDEHSAYIKLAPKTGQTVEDILWELRGRLGFNVLAHHGIKGQKWGVRNGPPYPIDKSSKESNMVKDAIESGRVSKIINKDKQRRHTLSGHDSGRSYINGDLNFAQELINKHSGKGKPITDKHGEWTKKERFSDDSYIGEYVNANGEEIKTKKGVIVYSKTGAHVYPGKEKK